MDGHHVEMELSLDTAAAGVQMAVEDKLLEGSLLSQLATRLLEHTLQWFSTVFKHLDAKFTRLTQVNISKEETLILPSKEVIIMYDRFHAVRRKHMDFTVNCSRVEYMVWSIWIAMQVHMVMDEFTQDGMKYDLALSAAFVRFLTKVTDGNGAAGVAGSIALLEAKLKNLDSALKEVKKEAAAASARATTANNNTEDVKGKFTKLYWLNLTLKK
jgi:hypothetical protein